jgi:molybdopterin/thiamine biosynthesis adenylyltransferase
MNPFVRFYWFMIGEMLMNNYSNIIKSDVFIYFRLYDSLMLAKFLDILRSHSNDDLSYRYEPIRFKLTDSAISAEILADSISKPGLFINDCLSDQIHDLIKMRNPNRLLTAAEKDELLQKELDGRSLHEYGTWVYYPWKHCLVHLLDEEDFIAVRTVRNRYKITPEDQLRLRNKAVGIIGLSVGQSVATAIAMERIAGTIKIADFDILELSNLNRIRTGVMNLGIPKCIAVAREIAEIDPFLNVEIFPEGITASNIEDFIGGERKLDLLIEESDNMEIKLLSRQVARNYKIPVVMDTSDLMLMDIERFDLEENRPILHGLIEENWDHLSADERKQLALKLIELDKVSEKGRESLMQIGKTITTWPQLATDVIAGGAVAAKFVREILLGNSVSSGRSRIDLVENHNQNARFRS